MRTLWKGVVLGAAIATLVNIGTAAIAGTGVGAVFNLGRVNSVDRTSTLTGTASGRMLQITNKGSGAALGLNVQAGRPPLAVNSGVRVTNLNADKLDGRDAASFLPIDGKAVDANHADMAEIARAAFNANDAAALGGIGASNYLRYAACPVGAIHGFVRVQAAADFPTTYTNAFSRTPYNGTCKGDSKAFAKRVSKGVYDVYFQDNPGLVAMGVANSPADRYVTLEVSQETVGGTSQFVHHVRVFNGSDGSPEDTTFTLLLI